MTEALWASKLNVVDYDNNGDDDNDNDDDDDDDTMMNKMKMMEKCVIICLSFLFSKFFPHLGYSSRSKRALCLF